MSELVYSKTSKAGITLNLYAVQGKRDYSNYIGPNGKPLIPDDKLFLLEIVDKNSVASSKYPYYTDDIAECAYNVIKNKTIKVARQKEADKILARIQDALRFEQST